MKNLISAVALAALFATPFAARAGDAPAATKTEKKEAFTRMSIEEVDAMVAAKTAFVFDNNSKESYAKGHVPTAKWVAFNDVKPTDLPAAKDAKLVFYCGGEKCTACHTAANEAIKLGYTNVSIMPAGISGWEKAKKKLEA